MNENNLHGSVFKKLREERGYKLKDVAGDVISTRTLMRFEADETSISIAIFEKLLKNCGISYLDYLVFYCDNVEVEAENNEIIKQSQNLWKEGSISNLVNKLKKEFKKNDIAFSRRVTILHLMSAIGWTEHSELFELNKKRIKEKLETTIKLGFDEICALRYLINSSSSREDYSVDYIDRIIQDCIQNIPIRNDYSRFMSIAYCDLLHASLAFLSRNGYYALAEKRCKDTIKLYSENVFLLNIIEYYTEVNGILAKIYLRQNKKEGIELANNDLKYRHIIAKIIDEPIYKQYRDIAYKAYSQVNKTGIDIEF